MLIDISNTFMKFDFQEFIATHFEQKGQSVFYFNRDMSQRHQANITFCRFNTFKAGFTPTIE